MVLLSTMLFMLSWSHLDDGELRLLHFAQSLYVVVVVMAMCYSIFFFFVIIIVAAAAAAAAEEAGNDITSPSSTPSSTPPSHMLWSSTGGGWRAMFADIGYSNIFQQAGLFTGNSSRFSAVVRLGSMCA